MTAPSNHHVISHYLVMPQHVIRLWCNISIASRYLVSHPVSRHVWWYHYCHHSTTPVMCRSLPSNKKFTYRYRESIPILSDPETSVDAAYHELPGIDMANMISFLSTMWRVAWRVCCSCFPWKYWPGRGALSSISSRDRSFPAWRPWWSTASWDTEGGPCQMWAPLFAVHSGKASFLPCSVDPINKTRNHTTMPIC